MYIDGLTQGLTEMMRDTQRPSEKMVNCDCRLYGECTKRPLRVKDKACVYCLERALEDNNFALSCDDP